MIYLGISVQYTGMIKPAWSAVFAFKFFCKCIIFTPWGPNAVPTGGAGVAFPAGNL